MTIALFSPFVFMVAMIFRVQAALLYMTNSIVDNIFDTVQDIIEGVVSIFTYILSNDGILGIFWTTGSGLTVVGVLLLIPVGFFLVKWGFAFVLKLLKIGQ